jgi:hypothetical protein
MDHACFVCGSEIAPFGYGWPGQRRPVDITPDQPEMDLEDGEGMDGPGVKADGEA